MASAMHFVKNWTAITVYPSLSQIILQEARPEEYKSRFAESHCLLAISVGQYKHEGEKLLSTLAKINILVNVRLC